MKLPSHPTGCGTALAGLTLLAGLTFGQLAFAQGKGIDEPFRDAYRKTLAGKTVAYVPVALGFDLAQGWYVGRPTGTVAYDGARSRTA